MAEKLGIYKSFGEGSAVDRKEFSPLSEAVLVDYPGYIFFTRTGLSGNEH